MRGALLPLLLLACAQVQNETSFRGPDEGADGVLRAALTQSALLDASVKSYRIRLYHGLPTNWPDSKPYFYSPCTALSPAFVVTNVKVGSGYTVIFEGYSDEPENGKTPVCKTLAALGVRGEIIITADGSGEALYYIQVYNRGTVTPFPVPGPDLNPPAGAGIQCESDDFCRDLIACDPGEACESGYKYRVHPKAVCLNGFCRVLSFFPLNLDEPHAFYAAFSANGKVATLGGFSGVDATGLSAQPSAVAEVFTADTSLFSKPAVPGFRNNFALPAVAPAGDSGFIAVFGGLRNIRFKDLVAFLGTSAVQCPQGNCWVEPLKSAYVFDSKALVARSYELPEPGALGVAGAVAVAGGHAILYRPGIVLGSEVVQPGDKAYVFLLSEGGSLSCASPLPEYDPTSSVLACKPIEGLIPRTLPAGACLEGSGTAGCKRFIIVGGHAAGPGAQGFAEVFDGENVITLDGEGTPKTLIGASLLNLGGKLVAFGGTTGEAEAAVLAFSTDLSRGVIKLDAINVQGDLSGLAGVFLQATPLADGKRVLVTGGLRGNTVSDNYYVLKVEQDTVTVTAQGKLSTPRVGHQSTLIRGSILNNSVFIGGGIAALGDSPTMAKGAELFLYLE